MASFRKPKRTGAAPKPAPCLHVAGLGDRLGHDGDELIQLINSALDSSCQITRHNVHTVDGVSYCFLDFENVDRASTAQAVLNGTRLIDRQGKQRVIVATFAEIRASAAEQIDSTSSLFDSEIRPPGMVLVEDFISISEENEVLSVINRTPWDSATLARRVQHFGFTFSYGLRGIDFAATTPPLPQVFQKLVLRMVERGLIPSKLEPNQCTVNEYTPGQGIARHIDTHSAFDDALLSLSLQAPVVMEFRKQQPGTLGGQSKESGWVDGPFPQPLADPLGGRGGVVIRRPELFPRPSTSGVLAGPSGDSQEEVSTIRAKSTENNSLRADGGNASIRDEERTQSSSQDGVDGDGGGLERSLVWLRPRSLLVLQGDARYSWSHAIAPRKFDRVDGNLVRRTGTRVSLTFRKVLFPTEGQNKDISDL